MSKRSVSSSVRRRAAWCVMATVLALGLAMLSPTASAVDESDNGGGGSQPSSAPGNDQGRGPQVGRVALVQVDTPALADRRRLAGLDLSGGTVGSASGETEVVLVGASDRAALRRAGFDWTVQVADLEERNRMARKEEQARMRQLPGPQKDLPDLAKGAAPEALSQRPVMPRKVQRRALPPQAQADLKGQTKPQVASSLPSGRVSYRTLFQINNELRYLAQTYPDKVDLFALPHRSLQGSKVWGVEITHDVDAQSGKPVYLMTGVHHAREWPSAEFSMEFAWHLLQNDGSDPLVTGLMDQVRVILVPVVNTDGFNISRSLIQEYKRKNCRIEPGQRPTPGQCSNPANSDLGVDVNRNYGAYWGGVGASPTETSGSYRGAAPFSEPVIKGMRHLVTHNPVAAFVSNHTYGELVLRAPANEFEPVPPDVDQYQGLAEDMAAENGYTPGTWPEALYPASGVSEQFGWYATGAFSFTFEIGEGGFHPPYPEGVIQEWPGNADAYLVGLEAAANPDTHAVLTGSAPEGAVLTAHKQFTMHTAPVIQPEGGRGPILPFPIEVEPAMTVQQDGQFSWHVNPSLRPSEFRSAYIQESYTLTCARPDGTVLQTAEVTVARGEEVNVDLDTCTQRW